MSRLIVGDIPRVNAEREPDGVAFVQGTSSCTWAQVDGRVDRLAHGLRDELGLAEGDVIAILADNRVEHMELMFAASRAKMIHTALKTRSSSKEMLRQFDDATPKVLVIGPGYEEQGKQIAAERGVALLQLEGSYEQLIADAATDPIESHQDAEAIYTIMYTSGSTGEPKGVAVSSRNELAYSWSVAWSIDCRPDDVYINVLPLVHRGGQYICMTAAFLGRPCVIGVPDPRAMLADISRNRVTVAILVPIIAKMMLDLAEQSDDHDLSSLRHFLVGSTPVPADLVKRMLAATNAEISQIGGGSEGAVMHCLSSQDYREIATNPAVEHRAAAVGRAAPGVRIALVDEDDNLLGPNEIGEFVYQGDAVIEGYWNKPELNAKAFRNGWFHSGDLGMRDEDGYYYYKDRLFGRIKTGGETVFSREIENVLVTHAAVAEVAVVGVPDDHWGEAVTAAVVAPGADPSAVASELEALVRAELAGFKVPKRFVFTSALPKTALMKVPYGEVKQALIDGTLPNAVEVSR